MPQIAIVQHEPEPAAPTAGPFYPGRCLECPEILAETYGCCAALRCVECVAADRVGRVTRPAVRPAAVGAGEGAAVS